MCTFVRKKHEYNIKTKKIHRMKKTLLSMLSVAMIALLMVSCGESRSYETVKGDPMQSRLHK
jgi:hypothetical protein